jgi:hypothetical protein
MTPKTLPKRCLVVWLSLVLLTVQNVWANTVVWTCSRSEPKQTVFEGIRAFRLEKLSAKDDDTISITLMDLYAAYGGEVIQMGKSTLAVCSLPPHDPFQISAMELLGFTSKDLIQAAKRPKSPLIVVPSIHEMHKCLNENHPAIGFFQNVVENERIAPCF